MCSLHLLLLSFLLHTMNNNVIFLSYILFLYWQNGWWELQHLGHMVCDVTIYALKCRNSLPTNQEKLGFESYGSLSHRTWVGLAYPGLEVFRLKVLTFQGYD